MNLPAEVATSADFFCVTFLETAVKQDAEDEMLDQLIHDMNLLICIDTKSINHPSLFKENTRYLRKLPGCCDMRSELTMLEKRTCLSLGQKMMWKV